MLRIPARLAQDTRVTLAPLEALFVYLQIYALHEIRVPAGHDLVGAITSVCTMLGPDPRARVAAAVAYLVQSKLLVDRGDGVFLSAHAPTPRSAHGASGTWAFLPGWGEASVQMQGAWRVHLTRKHRGDARLKKPVDMAFAREVWDGFTKTYKGGTPVTDGVVTGGAVTGTGAPAVLPSTTPTPPKGGGVVSKGAEVVTPTPIVSLPRGRSAEELAKLPDLKLGELLVGHVAKATNLFCSNGIVGKEALGADVRAGLLSEGEARVIGLHWRCEPNAVRAMFGITRASRVTTDNLLRGGMERVRTAALAWWRGLSSADRTAIDRAGGPVPYQTHIGVPDNPVETAGPPGAARAGESPARAAASGE